MHSFFGVYHHTATTSQMLFLQLQCCWKYSFTIGPECQFRHQVPVILLVSCSSFIVVHLHDPSVDWIQQCVCPSVLKWHLQMCGTIYHAWCHAVVAVLPVLYPFIFATLVVLQKPQQQPTQ